MASRSPPLRTYLTQGTYAEGVIGVVPTVTYPSHTTLVTGVWPAEHGIVDNTTFDPLGKHPGEWYWNFKDIKVPTLYTVAGARLASKPAPLAGPSPSARPSTTSSPSTRSPRRPTCPWSACIILKTS